MHTSQSHSQLIIPTQTEQFHSDFNGYGDIKPHRFLVHDLELHAVTWCHHWPLNSQCVVSYRRQCWRHVPITGAANFGDVSRQKYQRGEIWESVVTHKQTNLWSSIRQAGDVDAVCTSTGRLLAKAKASICPSVHHTLLFYQNDASYRITNSPLSGQSQEIWANAHETRHSISLISYADCLRLSPAYFSENTLLSVRRSLK